MTNSPSEQPGPLAWFRAAFVVFHLAAITAMAFPAPGGGMSKTAWRQPTVQAEFRAWSQRLDAIGLSMTSEELEERAWDFSTKFMGVRTSLLKPFGPYYKYAGTRQSWRMFVAPQRFPSALEIRVRETGTWRTVYQARSAEHDWAAAEFDHDRMRSAIFRYGWPHFRGAYRRMSDHYARRALVDFPDADAVQTRMYQYRTLSPEEASSGMDPDGSFVSSRVIKR